ncbi:MAG TPA: aminotransferase class V-fold PLP-dependent enzyme [Longimicrobiales bacterium]|nr:aminotransferase class V-fold PLP-dependent enzyme [Longimicrobiales bacterium]
MQGSEVMRGKQDVNGVGRIALAGAEFRTVGHELIDRIADLLDGIEQLPVARGVAPRAIRALLPKGGVPEHGADPLELFREVLPRLIDTSTFNSHPRFFGYISGSPAPVGILADLVASAVNPNCGSFILSPMATEIERQTIDWIADLLGFARPCGGLLVSGGNMANLVCFLAARAKYAPQARTDGAALAPLRVYATGETHTWINKAADISGLGAVRVRQVDLDAQQRMSASDLRRKIEDDKRAGAHPFLVIATAGSVSTGVIDPIRQIAETCRTHQLWLHVDGAYGAPAAILPDAPEDLKALHEADSLAVDPHKWFYSPLEAGAALVRDAEALRNAFEFHPSYYRFEGAEEDPPTNYYEYGPQNSRGFRALKVWLTIRQIGRRGFEKLISEDIALARLMYETAAAHPELEALTQHLSITTFRYVPPELRARSGHADVAAYLNELNTALVGELQAGGEVFLSNAVVDGRYALRACIVNFRTRPEDARAAVEVAVRVGRQLDARLRQSDRVHLLT